MSKRNVVVVFLFSFFAVFSLTACEIHNVNDVINNAASFVDVKADAYRAACDTVREQLDAPSEAKFPGYDSSFVTESASDDPAYDTLYKINAYVDAKNVLGGSMRNDWSARAYYNESDNKFCVNIDSLGIWDNTDAGSAADDNKTAQNNGGTNNNNNTYSSNYGSSSSANNSTNNSSNNSTYRYDDYDDYEDEYDDYESNYGSYDDDDDYDDEYDEYEEDYDSSSEYILPDSDSKKLTKYDLQGLTKAELRLARNEIYARHGRKFQDEALQDYFDEQDWYVGYIEPEDFVDSKMLSKLERRNAKFIMKFE